MPAKRTIVVIKKVANLGTLPIWNKMEMGNLRDNGIITVKD